MLDAGVEDAELDTRLLIVETLNINDISYALDPERKLTVQEVRKVMARVEKRAARQPLSQIFCEKEFWSLSFKVTSDTLTPRPDSETLVETALLRIKPKDRALTILDLGTGTGCLLLSLLSEYPNATGVGIDISHKALDVAKENANRLNLRTRAKFRQGNWTERLESNLKFDVIISNPPYIGTKEKEYLAPEVRDHEPEMALFSGEEGLDDYRRLAVQLQNRLKPNGLVILEIGFDQARSVKEIFISAGFNKISLYKDLGARDRCLVIEK